MINANTLALDVGCGTARWSKYLSSKVKFIEAIDPSKAIYAALKLTENIPNIRITQADSDCIPFEDGSFDFVFSLGVLHHVPNTQLALNKSVKKLKKNGYFLLYLYYSLENRGWFYKFLFNSSSLFRKIISKLPVGLKKNICDALAVFVYLPFVGLSLLIKKLLPHSNLYSKIPLSYYTDKSFNIICNDALDRFGTPLEKRFTKLQIEEMMKRSGLDEIVFSNFEPYWHAVGKKTK